MGLWIGLQGDSVPRECPPGTTVQIEPTKLALDSRSPTLNAMFLVMLDDTVTPPRKVVMHLHQESAKDFRDFADQMDDYIRKVTSAG